MAFWTVIGKGIGDELNGKSFGITLDTSESTWTAGGPDVGAFFKTRRGSYKVAGIPEHGTQLVGTNSLEIAFFTNLDGASPVGSSGAGRASESGAVFRWILDSK